MSFDDNGLNSLEPNLSGVQRLKTAQNWVLVISLCRHHCPKSCMKVAWHWKKKQKSLENSHGFYEQKWIGEVKSKQIVDLFSGP